MTKDKKVLILLHVLFCVYSLSSVLSKVSGSFPILGWQFFFSCGAMIGLLGLYAIGWQQVIKRISLTIACANRTITVVWGVVWGVLIFHETIN